MIKPWIDRLIRKANNEKLYVVYSSPRWAHFYHQPVEVYAHNLYDANRWFDVNFPDRLRRKTVAK